MIARTDVQEDINGIATAGPAARRLWAEDVRPKLTQDVTRRPETEPRRVRMFERPNLTPRRLAKPGESSCTGRG